MAGHRVESALAITLGRITAVSAALAHLLQRKVQVSHSSSLCISSSCLSVALGHERQRLEQLCWYITRPALANERVQINSAGQVVLKLKTAWRDGTTHIVMSPLEFMQRLAVRATEGRLSCARAAAPAASDPLPRGAGAQCQAMGHGGAARPRAGHRQIGAHRDQARLRAWPGGAHQLGPAAQARVPDRHRALPALRWSAQDHCGHPGGARDKSGSSGTWDCKPGHRPGCRRAAILSRRPDRGPAPRAPGRGCA